MTTGTESSSSTVKTGLIAPLLTLRGERVTKVKHTVLGVDGSQIAELSTAPALLIAQTIANQRQCKPLLRFHREEALRRASEIFLHSTLDGFTFEDHLRAVSMVSGHPYDVVKSLTRAVAESIEDAPRRAYLGRPSGSVESWHEAVNTPGAGVWSRRGEVLGAVLSGNSPAVHGPWLQALALGYRVAVRPSQREPLTGLRVVRALLSAGFQTSDISFLPTDHRGADEILRRSDLGLIHGGADINRKYGNDPRIKVGGPGRSKTVVTATADWNTALDSVVTAVTAQSGAACVNTSAVMIDGDHRLFAEQLRERLRKPDDIGGTQYRHSGPRVSAEVGESVVAYLRRRSVNVSTLVALESIAQPDGTGAVLLTPAIFAVDDPADELLGLEFGFPCVSVTPWRPAGGIESLRNSLVVNVIGDGDEVLKLVDSLIGDSTITNVHLNSPTTYADPRMPHDGYIGEFLMTSKGFAAYR